MQVMGEHALGRHRYASEPSMPRAYSPRGHKKFIARQRCNLIVRAERLEREAKLRNVAEPDVARALRNVASELRTKAAFL